MSLSKTILSCCDIAEESLPIPEWDCTILIRGLGGIDRDNFERSMINDDPKSTEHLINTRARFAQLVCYDPETKTKIFTEADIPALGTKSAEVLTRIMRIGRRLSNLADDVDTQAKK